MFTVKQVYFIVCALAFSASADRFVRSPDKMEINIPNYSYEKESGEYQENMNEEAAYWQGQGDKEEGQPQLDKDREKNQETYESEKEHSKGQQQSYNKEINETYQGDRDTAEAHYESNQDHYMQYHGNDYDAPSTNKTAEELTETETGDRYGEKGTEYVEDGQDKIQNHDVNANAPSISYTTS